MIDLLTKVSRILEYAGGNTRFKFFLVVVFVSIGALFDFVGISMLIPLIAAMLPGEQSYQESNDGAFGDFLILLTESLGIAGLLKVIVTVFFLKAVYGTTMYYIQARFCFNTQATIAEKLALKYLTSHPPIFYRRDTSEYIRNCLQETDQFNFSVLISLISLISEVVVILSLTVLLLLIDWRTSMTIIILAISLSGFFIIALRGPLDRAGHRRQHHFGLRLKALRQAIDGFKEISIAKAAELLLHDFTQHNRKGNSANYRAHWMSQIPRMWIEFFAVLSIFSSVFIILSSGTEASDLISVVGVFAAAAVRLMPSVSRVMTSINYLIYSRPVLTLLTDEINSDLRARSLFWSVDGVAPDGTLLKIKDAVYRHEGNPEWALALDHFSVKSDEKVVIFGESGSGKTTLMDILVGFKVLENGAQYLSGGVKSLDDWWDCAAYCGQSVYIFDRDLRYNIALSDEGVDEERLQASILAAGLKDVASSLDDRGGSLGESGSAISGGQRQRIGIARALYKTNTLVSFFDEVTSNLDSNLAHRIVPKIIEWNRGKSVVFISHDTTLAQYFDTVYKVRDGRIYPDA